MNTNSSEAVCKRHGMHYTIHMLKKRSSTFSCSLREKLYRKGQNTRKEYLKHQPYIPNHGLKSIWVNIELIEDMSNWIYYLGSSTTGRIKIARFSNGIFSVFSNDKYKKYNTIWSAWEFSKNREQPEVCSSIRLEVMLFQSKDNKRRVVKKSEKIFIQSPFRMNGNVQDDLHLLNSIKNGEKSKSITCLWNQQKTES